MGGGLLLVSDAQLGMRFQGLALLLVGGLALAIWIRQGGPEATTRVQRPTAGPTFVVDDPAAPDLAPSTTNLIQEVRRIRQGQKRARD